MNDAEKVSRKVGSCSRCRLTHPVYFLPGQEHREVTCPRCRLPLQFGETAVMEVWRALEWTFLQIVKKVRPLDHAVFLRREELLASFPVWERKSLNLAPQKTAGGLVAVKRFHSACPYCNRDNRLFFLTDFAVSRAACEGCGKRLANPTVTKKLAGLTTDGVCCIVDRRPLSPVIVDRPSDLSVMSKEDLEILGLL